jgi:hypothetical protein
MTQRDTITLHESGSVSMSGRDAVEVFRLATLVSGLRFEISCPGMKISRISALQAAKHITGLRTNSREKHLERALVMLAYAKARVDYIDGRPLTLSVWEERDRLHIHVTNSSGETVAEWRDDEARAMFTDGFFKSGAVSIGRLRESDPVLLASVLEYVRETVLEIKRAPREA